MREYLDSTDGAIQMALLPGYAPDLNPVEYLWAWLKRHALTNFCSDNLAELKHTAPSKLKSGQKRNRPSLPARSKPSFGDVMIYVTLDNIRRSPLRRRFAT
ncbi:hypothetical protein OKW34_000270 [Paraburkholderia youngii]